MSTTISLGEAWGQWRNGQVPPHHLLWGVEIFWWGRIGKALQVLAGATILAEIIGAPALRSFGNSLHGRITVATFRTNAGATLKAAFLAWKYYLITRPAEEDERLLDELQTYKSAHLAIILAIAVGVYTGFFVKISGFWLWQSLVAFGIFVLTAIFVSPVIVAVVTVLLLAAGVVIDILLIEPIAWVLEREHLDKLVKIAALLLLLSGFHFDFLAS